MKVERIKRELVRRGPILDIYEDTMQIDNGKIEKWDFVSHRMGAACVIPVLSDGRILMVRQYRNALERETLEVPAGCRDSLTEDTLICAKRELEEETGYHSENINYLMSLKTTVAFCDEAIDVYMATDLIPGKQHLDESEEINVEAYSLEELQDMIFAGKLQDSKTICAIMGYSTYIARKNEA
ncbi:MAG: NUDIX hydrolase [Agathobacter sp.]|nr:NUDIX hydrolase [Agathobacter sp.]